MNHVSHTPDYLRSLESTQMPSPIRESRASNRSALLLSLAIVLVFVVLIGLSEYY